MLCSYFLLHKLKLWLSRAAEMFGMRLPGPWRMEKNFTRSALKMLGLPVVSCHTRGVRVRRKCNVRTNESHLNVRNIVLCTRRRELCVKQSLSWRERRGERDASKSVALWVSWQSPREKTFYLTRVLCTPHCGRVPRCAEKKLEHFAGQVSVREGAEKCEWIKKKYAYYPSHSVTIFLRNFFLRFDRCVYFMQEFHHTHTQVWIGKFAKPIINHRQLTPCGYTLKGNIDRWVRAQ